MTTVFKYTFPILDEVLIEMPSGARLLTVQVQGNGGPCLWAVVDPSARTVKRHLRVAGTGHPLEDGFLPGRNALSGWGPDARAIRAIPYVGTFQLRDGGLVFHVFDLGEVK